MPKRKQFEIFMEKYGKNCETIEVVRQVLAEQKDFSFANIFRRLNKINKDGFITDDEIVSYLKESGIRHNQEIVEFLMKTFDHDNDGNISFPDLLLSMIPQEGLLNYKDSIRRIRGKFRVDDLGGPPDEVVFENYIDDNGNLVKEALYFWPRLVPASDEEEMHYISNISSSLEFALK